MSQRILCLAAGVCIGLFLHCCVAVSVQDAPTRHEYSTEAEPEIAVPYPGFALPQPAPPMLPAD